MEPERCPICHEPRTFEEMSAREALRSELIVQGFQEAERVQVEAEKIQAAEALLFTSIQTAVPPDGQRALVWQALRVLRGDPEALAEWRAVRDG